MVSLRPTIKSDVNICQRLNTLTAGTFGTPSMLIAAASSALLHAPASQVRSRLSGTVDQQANCSTAVQCNILEAQHKSLLHQGETPAASPFDGSITGSWSCRTCDSRSTESANSPNTGIACSQVNLFLSEFL